MTIFHIVNIWSIHTDKYVTENMNKPNQIALEMCRTGLYTSINFVSNRAPSRRVGTTGIKAYRQQIAHVEVLDGTQQGTVV